MTFIGKIWRILIGIKDGLVLMAMLLFIGLLYAALSSTPNSATVHTGALYVDLNGTIVEQPQQASPQELLLGGGQSHEHRLRDVVHVLEKAANDPRIKVVALDLDGFTTDESLWHTVAVDVHNAVRVLALRFMHHDLDDFFHEREFFGVVIH